MLRIQARFLGAPRPLLASFGLFWPGGAIQKKPKGPNRGLPNIFARYHIRHVPIPSYNVLVVREAQPAQRLSTHVTPHHAAPRHATPRRALPRRSELCTARSPLRSARPEYATRYLYHIPSVVRTVGVQTTDISTRPLVFLKCTSIVQADSSKKKVCQPQMPCLLYTSPSPRDKRQSRMPSSA